MICDLPFWSQLPRVFGSVDVHTSIHRAGSFPRWHTHPLWFLFLFIGSFLLLITLLFLTFVTPTESSTSSSIQPPFLVPPRPLRDLFEEGEPEKCFGGLGIFLLDLCGEPSFGVSGRETDESLERTSSQR